MSKIGEKEFEIIKSLSKSKFLQEMIRKFAKTDKRAKNNLFPKIGGFLNSANFQILRNYLLKLETSKIGVLLNS